MLALTPRFMLARNFDDFLQRDLKVYTAPRALGTLLCITMGAINGNPMLTRVIGYCNRLVPVGQFGITKASQTPFFHKFGRIPTLAVRLMPLAGNHCLT